MTIESLLILLIIGAVAGWLAGIVVKGYGFGLLGNIVVGIVGAFIGGYVFSALGVGTNGLIGQIICAAVGAVILLFVIKIIKKT